MLYISRCNNPSKAETPHTPPSATGPDRSGSVRGPRRRHGRRARGSPIFGGGASGGVVRHLAVHLGATPRPNLLGRRHRPLHPSPRVLQHLPGTRRVGILVPPRNLQLSRQVDRHRGASRWRRASPGRAWGGRRAGPGARGGGGAVRAGVSGNPGQHLHVFTRSAAPGGAGSPGFRSRGTGIPSVRPVGFLLDPRQFVKRGGDGGWMAC